MDTENEKYSNIFEFKDKIKFENVFYSFKGRKPILENINFEINKNDFIGIIGETGSGKSTLIKLMMGFIAPSKGKIIVDENNLEIIKNNFSKHYRLCASKLLFNRRHYIKKYNFWRL